ncbi:MAG: hypothetical protein ACRDRI_08395 [Pseudonocardiaceae bacterium]
MPPAGYEPSPVDKAAKLLFIFMLVILVLLLLNLGGGYTAAHIPPVAEAIHDILHELWAALHRVIQAGYQH